MRWAGYVARMGVMRNVCSILIGKSEEKRPLGRPMRRWQDHIRMNFKEIIFEVVGWMHLAQDRDQWWDLVNTVVNFRVS